MEITYGTETADQSLVVGNVLDLLKKFTNSKIQTKFIESPNEIMKEKRMFKIQIEDIDIENIKKVEFYLRTFKQIFDIESKRIQ